ncbi:MAG: hypothetical protein KME46_27955 [Brasilonema angustatum HA4187-MV1]|nr:hypothetical protein [Brasilonema angustatum HA4187-MV1]
MLSAIEATGTLTGVAISSKGQSPAECAQKRKLQEGNRRQATGIAE